MRATITVLLTLAAAAGWAFPTRLPLTTQAGTAPPPEVIYVWTAEEPPRTSEGHENTVVMILMAVDYLQTREIARNPDRWTEFNPLLGAHPSEAEVTRHFLMSAAVYVLAMHLLPERYQAEYRESSIQLQFAVTANNYIAGIRF